MVGSPRLSMDSIIIITIIIVIISIIIIIAAIIRVKHLIVTIIIPN